MKSKSLVVLAALLLCSCSNQKTVTMPVSTLSDKIRGGWAGQTIGCTYGSPTEFKYSQPVADSVLIPWTGKELAYYFNEVPGMYDDVYMDLTFVEILENQGLDAPASSFAEAFANAGYQLWHANQEARYNILSGLQPPQSGYWKNNPHADDIDFQIECDFAGLMCPGMPAAAAGFCDTVGHIMNYGDGWYGGVFIASMYSFAFIEDDIPSIVRKANDIIPEGTRFHRCIDTVLAAYEADHTDWRKAWDAVERGFGEDIGCPSCVYDPTDIDAVINSAYVAIGLLYGEKDFGRSIDIATRCGQDSDCNPASVGGILGVIGGYDAIPEKWTAPLKEFEDIDFVNTSTSLDRVYDISLKHALEVIKRNGGEVSGDMVSIRTDVPFTVPFEQSFEGIVPTGRKVFEKPVAKVPQIEFDGTGIVVRYWFRYAGEEPEDYVALVDVMLDGAKVSTVSLPVDYLKRKLELWFDYDIPTGHHTLSLEWTNARSDMDIIVSSAVTYDSPLTGGEPVSVMSYNMLFEHNVPEEPLQRWESRRPNQIATINALKPDVIGSQELQSYQVADIVEGTGYERVGLSLAGTLSDTDRNENECIFFNPERLELIDSGDFWFSATPDVPSHWDEISYNRKCTWAEFCVRGTRSRFYVFNSHFYYEYDKPELRMKCARTLVQKLRAVPAGIPVFVTGDLNALVSDSCVRTILSAGFRDSRAIALETEGPEGSYYGFETEREPVERLDHILVTGPVAVDRHSIIDDQIKTGKAESDHLPVLVEARIPFTSAGSDGQYEFRQASDLNLIGKALEGTSNPYHRVDTTQYTGFSDYVNKLLRCSAGLAVLFRTDSKVITVRSKYGFIYNTTGTPPISYMGYDLYIKRDGGWVWAGAASSYIRGGEDNVVILKDMAEGVKECLLYMPMYSEVLSCEIGVTRGSLLEPLESEFRHKLCVYGSSFTQGVCTSHAGMSYPMQFMRNTGIQVVSLATSGNAMMQPEVSRVLRDVEADAFLFDTFSNPGSTVITERLVDFIDEMIDAHPGKPLIFQQTIWEPCRNFNVANDEWNARKMATAERIMREEVLGKTKYKDVYFIHPETTTGEYCDYADGIHPDDYGYFLWEKSIEKKVLRILRKYGIR